MSEQAESVPPATRPSKPAARGESLWDLIKTILIALSVAALLRIMLFELFQIEGPSMEPSLLNGDRVIVSKFPYGVFLPWTSEALVTWGRPNIGDIVIVDSPADSKDIVKRVIALAGDTVEIRDNVVYRNGVAIPQKNLGGCAEQEFPDPGCETYEETLEGRTYRTTRSLASLENAEPTRIPAGHIYVLGDHRDRSNDSHTIGPIPENRVRGHATRVLWSSDDSSGQYRVRWDRMLLSLD